MASRPSALAPQPAHVKQSFALLDIPMINLLMNVLLTHLIATQIVSLENAKPSMDLSNAHNVLRELSTLEIFVSAPQDHNVLPTTQVESALNAILATISILMLKQIISLEDALYVKLLIVFHAHKMG